VSLWQGLDVERRAEARLKAFNAAIRQMDGRW
jgi:hypothetical protein